MADAEAAGFWSAIKPGQPIYLRFPGDGVWHEFVYLWKAGEAAASIYSPDEDLYVEWLFNKE